MSDIDRLAALFAGARRAVVFTGAGVSTESGIPDFRSPGGVWARFDPRAFTYQSFVGSLEGRRRYRALGRVTYPIIRAAVPNAAHLALAELHRLGRAKRAGATLAIVTLEPTRADADADLVVRGSAGAVMTAVLDAGRVRSPQGG